MPSRCETEKQTAWGLGEGRRGKATKFSPFQTPVIASFHVHIGSHLGAP